jgi:hypothetical protein
MRSYLPAALFLIVVGTLAASVAAPQEQAVPAPPSPATLPPPLPPGPAPDLDLVFTAQVAGYVEPCG